jgi:hypothetical protein
VSRRGLERTVRPSLQQRLWTNASSRGRAVRKRTGPPVGGRYGCGLRERLMTRSSRSTRPVHSRARMRYPATDGFIMGGGASEVAPHLSKLWRADLPASARWSVASFARPVLHFYAVLVHSSRALTCRCRGYATISGQCTDLPMMCPLRRSSAPPARPYLARTCRRPRRRRCRREPTALADGSAGDEHHQRRRANPVILHRLGAGLARHDGLERIHVGHVHAQPDQVGLGRVDEGADVLRD